MASSGRTSSVHVDVGNGGNTASARRTSGARFAATRWSIVLAAAGRGGTNGGQAASTSASRRALEELIGAYWFPLYAFIRRQGNDPQQSEDLTQGFFAHLLENQGLATVDRSKGKFRSFLLVSLKHFMADQHDKARALKRGGERKIVSLDVAQAEAHYAREPADSMTPERHFERSWAIAVLNHVISRLEQEYTSRGKSAVFQALRHTLDGQASEHSHAQVAEELHTSEGAVRVMAHRLRCRYREVLRDEIRQTVENVEFIDEEITYLINCL